MQICLGHSVLVLNRNWVVVHVTNLKRALCLIFQGYARIVAEDMQTYDFDSWRELSRFADADAPCLTTPTFRFRLPEVIQLLRYSRMPPRRVKFSRRNIFLRDQYTCQYCGCRPTHAELTIDHVVPKSRSGHSIWENVVLSCVRCNARKGSHLLGEVGMKLLARPKRPNWLACTLQGATNANRPTWSRFIDQAYWNVALREE